MRECRVRLLRQVIIARLAIFRRSSRTLRTATGSRQQNIAAFGCLFNQLFDRPYMVTQRAGHRWRLRELSAGRVNREPQHHGNQRRGD